MKANYARGGGEIRLRWADGVYEQIAEDPGMVGSLRRGNAERVFLELLEATKREGRSVSDNKHAGNFAPAFFAQRADSAGFAKDEFRRAMEALFVAGKIRVETYGRKHDSRQRIVAVQPETEGEDQ